MFNRIVGTWAVTTGVTLVGIFFKQYRGRILYAYLFLYGIAALLWGIDLLRHDAIVPLWVVRLFFGLGLFWMLRDSVRRYRETYASLREEKLRELFPDAYPTDLLAVARELESVPLLDTSDGSTSWFDMRHEEGIATDRNGKVLFHQSVPSGIDRMVWSSDITTLVIDGGLILHSHPAPGSSFSLADLEMAVKASALGRGIVLCLTTSHPIDGVPQRIRYLVDSRSTQGFPKWTRERLRQEWDELFRSVDVTPFDDDDQRSADELYAQHVHEVVGSICASCGITYVRDTQL